MFEPWHIWSHSFEWRIMSLFSKGLPVLKAIMTSPLNRLWGRKGQGLKDSSLTVWWKKGCWAPSRRSQTRKKTGKYNVMAGGKWYYFKKGLVNCIKWAPTLRENTSISIATNVIVDFSKCSFGFWILRNTCLLRQLLVH